MYFLHDVFSAVCMGVADKDLTEEILIDQADDVGHPAEPVDIVDNR